MANIWLILMIIIWLMMVNNNLLGGIPTPLKNRSSSVGMMKVPIYGKIIQMFQTKNQPLVVWQC